MVKHAPKTITELFAEYIVDNDNGGTEEAIDEFTGCLYAEIGPKVAAKIKPNAKERCLIRQAVREIVEKVELDAIARANEMNCDAEEEASEIAEARTGQY